MVSLLSINLGYYNTFKITLNVISGEESRIDTENLNRNKLFVTMDWNKYYFIAA